MADAALLASLLKDIKSERPKITEKDNLRLLFITKWFLEYFLAVRTQEKGAGASEPWAFGLVGEVIKRSWLVRVLKRMNGAVEEKVREETLCHSNVIFIHASSTIQPKLWTELQAGIECLTQLLALVGAMSSAKAETDEAAELHEAAVLLQQQLVYNDQVLDAALDGLRVYKDGAQSLVFLRSSVHLMYALMRMLEKWAKTTGDGSYVRKRPSGSSRSRQTGSAGAGGRPEPGTGADWTTTTQVTSNVSITITPPPFADLSFFRSCVWSRAAKASAIGGLSPTPNTGCLLACHDRNTAKVSLRCSCMCECEAAPPPNCALSRDVHNSASAPPRTTAPPVRGHTAGSGDALTGNKQLGGKNGIKPGLKDAVQLKPLDFNKKIPHASWHPRENTITAVLFHALQPH
jgi:hypothetical protein